MLMPFSRFSHFALERITSPKLSFKASGIVDLFTMNVEAVDSITYQLGDVTKTVKYEDMDTSDIIERMNSHIPMGLKVIGCQKLEQGYVPLHKIESAIYRATVEYSGSADIEKFLSNDEIIVDKKTKKGINPTDIKPMIYDIEKISDHDGCMVLKMHLSAGEKNLKPDTVFDAFEKYFDGFKVEFSDITREKIFFGKNIEIMN